MRLGIVGAGQAACTLIAELIRGDFKGDILVFNGEPHAPYQRPPLSKNWLKTSDDPTSLRLLPEPLETHPSIQWIQTSVQSLSPDRGLLTTDLGTYLVDHLVLATGTTAIKPSIPGLASESIHVVRTLDHALRLKQSLTGVTNITIIGAGFLAFEIASSLADPSRTIRILAKGIRALPQVAVKTADRLVDQTPASIRVGVEIERFDETMQTLVTNHGSIPTDLVIAAIGAQPNDALATACGLGSSDGIPVDEFMQTTHPKVSAIGEVSLHHQPHLNRIQRIESISEANDSASICAKRLLGHPEPFQAIPWFWSDQGDAKLQIAGLCDRTDDETCLIESATELVMIRHQGQQVTAIEALNSAKEFMAARRLLDQGDLALDDLLQVGSVFARLQSSRS